MKKIKLLQASFAWLMQKEHLFFCISSLVSLGLVVATVILFPFYWGIFLTVLVMSVIVWLKLFIISSEPFGNHYLAIGWALIAFTLSFKLATVSAITDEYGIRHDDLPILWAGLLSSVIYFIAPKISSLLGLSNDESAGFNNPVWILIFYIALSVLSGISDNMDKMKAKEKIEWEQAQFEPVLSWQVEVWDAETIYLITTKKGTFFVYPYHCPRIRKINKNTQVRVLFDREIYNRGGARRPRKLEIKN